jgi:4-hydroxybenzoate polyprenyltransferase
VSTSAAQKPVSPPEPSRIRAFLRLVMIEHSVFALPFALIAAFTAMWLANSHVHWLQLVLIVVAMVSARTVAMAANRILDRRFDALNPRTAHRELVTGALSLGVARRGLAVALVIFLASAAALGWLPLLLSPVAVGLLVLYSYGKRFTDFPQVLLALAQAVAPIGAWMGVSGGFAWPATALGLAVGTWIGGFDLIYSCQDADIDRAIGSRSFPARFGIPAALRWSSVTHVATVACYAWFGLTAGLGAIWWVGLALTAAVLVYEHTIVRADDLSRVNRAFFTANGFVGIQLFLFALVDLVVHGLRP